ncbi:hypothetical protein AB0N16_28535 [Streptomyces sp. NPDC051105]|uniref:hypothetical protein n=1 Tax=Streptomyces sp. NPDC051105 TaxID=3154843 RepID=UPI00342BBD6A
MTNTDGWTIPLQDVELVPERTLGTPTAQQLAHRLSFGQDILPVAEPYAFPEWCSYAEGLAHARTFRLLAMVCSFHPEEPDSSWIMEKGKLALSLRTEGETPPRAIGRRIDPGERTRPVNSVPSTVSFSFNAGLFGAGVQHPLGGSATGYDWIVQGYGENQSQLRWRFRSTKHHPLVGDHPLAVLIEYDPAKEHRVEILFSAELKHPTLGLRRHRGQLPVRSIPLTT